MILLRIVTETEKQAMDIAGLLLREKLILNPNLRYHMRRLELQDEVVTGKPVYILSAKSRSVLFTTIERKLQQAYPDEMPEVYSLAVIHMDWEHASQLSREIDF